MSPEILSPDGEITPVTQAEAETPLVEGGETLERVDGGWSFAPKVDRVDYWADKKQQSENGIRPVERSEQ